MLLLGLTGGIASGKSTVSKMLTDLGWHVIDADEIAKKVVEPGTPGLKVLIKEFGKEILSNDGQLDRKALGKIIFSNPSLRNRLNQGLHPLILNKIKDKVEYLEKNSSHRMVVIDAPLLMETGLDKTTDYNIVVSLDKNMQLERLMKRDKLELEEAEKRINSQMPLPEKLKRADFIIDNSGSISETASQVRRLYQEIKSSINPNESI